MTVLNEEDITKTATAEAAKRGLSVLRLHVRGSKQKPVIELTLDGDHLVGIDDCETVSKAISAFIDGLSSTEIDYRLDVLSPGISEPLVYDYQFKRSIGRMITVSYIHDEKNIEATGELKQFDTDVLVLVVKQKKNITTDAVIQRADIQSAKQIAVIK